MIVSHHKRLAFIAIPKTGTRSVYRAFEDNFAQVQHLGDHGIMVPSSMRDYRKFTVIRDPYSRFASMYRSMCCDGRNRHGWTGIMKRAGYANTIDGFAHVVADHLQGEGLQVTVQPQVKWLEPNPDAKIFLHENLFELEAWLGVKLPHLNRTEGDKSLPRSVRAIVEDIYEKDLDAYERVPYG